MPSLVSLLSFSVSFRAVVFCNWTRKYRVPSLAGSNWLPAVLCDSKYIHFKCRRRSRNMLNLRCCQRGFPEDLMVWVTQMTDGWGKLRLKSSSLRRWETRHARKSARTSFQSSANAAKEKVWCYHSCAGRKTMPSRRAWRSGMKIPIFNTSAEKSTWMKGRGFGRLACGERRISVLKLGVRPKDPVMHEWDAVQVVFILRFSWSLREGAFF